MPKTKPSNEHVAEYDQWFIDNVILVIIEFYQLP